MTLDYFLHAAMEPLAPIPKDWISISAPERTCSPRRSMAFPPSWSGPVKRAVSIGPSRQPPEFRPGHTVVGPCGKLGGIEWGTASDNQRIYVADSQQRTRQTYTLQPSGAPLERRFLGRSEPGHGGYPLASARSRHKAPSIPSQHALALGPVTVAERSGLCRLPCRATCTRWTRPPERHYGRSKRLVR